MLILEKFLVASSSLLDTRLTIIATISSDYH